MEKLLKWKIFVESVYDECGVSSSTNFVSFFKFFFYVITWKVFFLENGVDKEINHDLFFFDKIDKKNLFEKTEISFYLLYAVMGVYSNFLIF